MEKERGGSVVLGYKVLPVHKTSNTQNLLCCKRKTMHELVLLEFDFLETKFMVSGRFSITIAIQTHKL